MEKCCFRFYLLVKLPSSLYQTSIFTVMHQSDGLFQSTTHSSSEHQHHRLSMLVMISNVLWCQQHEHCAPSLHALL